MDMLSLVLKGVSHAQIPYPLSSVLRLADDRPFSCRPQPEKHCPKSLSPPEQAIRNWVKQDDLDNGRREDDLTTEERSELRRLRRENKAQDRAGDPGKIRGLVRPGDRDAVLSLVHKGAPSLLARSQSMQPAHRSPPAATMAGICDPPRKGP